MSNAYNTLLAVVASNDDRQRNFSDSWNVNRRIALDSQIRAGLTPQILDEYFTRALGTRRREHWPSSVDQIAQQIGTHVPIQAVVFKLVFEAPKAFVARDVTVAIRESAQRSVKHL